MAGELFQSVVMPKGISSQKKESASIYIADLLWAVHSHIPECVPCKAARLPFLQGDFPSDVCCETFKQINRGQTEGYKL